MKSRTDLLRESLIVFVSVACGLAGVSVLFSGIIWLMDHCGPWAFASFAIVALSGTCAAAHYIKERRG
jgi:hypothetical protein